MSSQAGQSDLAVGDRLVLAYTKLQVLTEGKMLHVPSPNSFVPSLVIQDKTDFESGSHFF